jgi:hypothetical protein
MSTTNPPVRKPTTLPQSNSVIPQAVNGNTKPAGNQQGTTSNHTIPPSNAVKPSPSNSTHPSKSSQQSSSSSSSSFTSALAATLANKPLLPVSDRSLYKTFILSHGVFEVENKYIMKEMIGQGAYGVVCSAFDLKKQSLVAVKKIENVFDHRSLAKRTLRELMIVRALQHENILGIDRVIRPHNQQFNNIYMVSELMETDLACVIRSPQELTEEHVQFFIYQVLRGLKVRNNK